MSPASCHVQNMCFFTHLLELQLLKSFCSPFNHVHRTNVPFVAEHSADIYSLCCKQFWIFCANHCPLHKGTSLVRSESWSYLWKDFALNYKYESLENSIIIIIIILENSFILFPSSRVMVAGSPLRSGTAIYGFLDLVCISSCRAGLRFNQKAVGYPITLIPILHTWAYLAIPVIITAHRAHGWVNYWLFFPPSGLHRTFQCYKSNLVFHAPSLIYVMSLLYWWPYHIENKWIFIWISSAVPVLILPVSAGSVKWPITTL